MYPHRIRLNGPWELSSQQASERIHLPDGWPQEALGLVELSRRFGTPSNLEEGERVWLTVDGLRAQATLHFNDTNLGHIDMPRFACEVTNLLQARNRVTIATTLFAGQPGWREIALDIRRQAYLDDVQITREAGQRYIVGQVAGTAEQVLELYVMVAGRHEAYRTIAAGARSRIELPAEGTPVRVELIATSVVWYVVEIDDATPV